jgi:hypothetical protein
LKFLIGKYEATIYPEGNGYTGAIDVGYDGRGNRQRIKRKGRNRDRQGQAQEGRPRAGRGHRDQRHVHGRERRQGLASQGHKGLERQDDPRRQEPR